MDEVLVVGDEVGTVKSFVVNMCRHFISVPRNVDMIRKLYDAFLDMPLPLPPIEALDDEYVNKITLFRYLYSEMRYRQIFALSPPTVKQRIRCWNNYCRIFEFLSPNTCMMLPNEWLWDMIDGFVNQFQSFCEFRASGTITEEDAELLQRHQFAWSVFGTLHLLLKLVEESSIREILEAAEDGVSAVTDDSGQIDIPRTLGYFSLVGLLRVHCLLGQFETGLKRLKPINICHPGFYTCLIGSHITIVYHCVFASFMTGRYIEAMSGLQMFLVHISKTQQLYQKSRDFEQIICKTHQMYALLALFHVLCSPHNLIDDANVESKLKERFGDKISRMERFEDESFSIFCELLNTVWPIYKKPFAPHIGDPRQDARLKLSLRGHYVDEEKLQRMYPPSCIPFDPDDKEPYISHQNQLDTLIELLISARMSRLKLK